MESLEERETAGFKFCHACSAELRKTDDKYCRRCGARLNHDTARLDNDQQNSSIAPHTNPLSDPADFRQVSSPLVRTVTAGISAPTSANLKNRYARSLILALLSIPICLMMVLLAPLDAFEAAKGIAHQSFLR